MATANSALQLPPAADSLDVGDGGGGPPALRLVQEIPLV